MKDKSIPVLIFLIAVVTIAIIWCMFCFWSGRNADQTTRQTTEAIEQLLESKFK